MRILIVTQAVDSTDPVLGFFHRWLQECGAVFAQVTVIGQRVGAHALPENVTVRSMGKEAGVPRPLQILRFWRQIRSGRGAYDAVLVHMTPIWVILGWPLWALARKPVYLWYEARGTRWPLRMALLLVQKIFSASPYGMPLQTPKSVITGHGIDTDLFRPGSGETEDGLLLSVGRVTASKRLPLLLDCLRSLPPATHLTIVGEPRTPADAALAEELKQAAASEGLKDRLSVGPLPQTEVVPLLQRAQLFLHASETSLDKALLEAMACGCVVLSCAEAARSVLPATCLTTPEGLPDAAARLLKLDAAERRRLGTQLRQKIEAEHGLPRLIRRLAAEMV
jgi:glycosyltransferase involved in cell wall biosynthesis